MQYNIPNTPFPTSGYHGPDYFCDREDETRVLERNIESGQSTTIAALRRLGKTALLTHIQYLKKPDWTPVYVDILPTENINDLFRYLANAIVHSYSEKSAHGKRIWKLIKSLRPVFSYDALTGLPNFSFALKPDESKQSIEDLFSLLENGKNPVLFAIDEFQQILSYPETSVDAWLRSIIQKLNNVVFLFSGSQQHLMTDLFTNPSRPFFRSTQFLRLEKISGEVYADFIAHHFKKNSITISPGVISEMLNWADLHTFYVQLLCNRVYTSRESTITTETWQSEARKLLKEQEYVFFGYREMLTIQQWSLLKAIAKEGTVSSPYSMDFISNHKLGNPSSVRRSMESLLSKELIYKELSSNEEHYFGVYDVLFKRWIETI